MSDELEKQLKKALKKRTREVNEKIKGENRMENVKIGDRVRCIARDFMYVTCGKEYEVIKITDSTIGIIDDDGDLVNYHKADFEPVTETTIETTEKGAYNMQNIKELYTNIEAVHFNKSKRTTVIRFNNGDKVKATCSTDTQFSEYGGFVAALTKYQYGSVEQISRLLKRKVK